MKIITFLVLLLVPILSGAAHITDRLLAGMYASPDTKAEPIKLLPSGTPLDILSEKNGLVKVKLVDGKEGWVEKRFLSEDKPAKSKLLVLQSKYKQMQREFDETKRELIKLKATNKSSDKSVNVTATEKQAQLKAELLALQKQLKESRANKTSSGDVELALKKAQEEISLLKIQLKGAPELQSKVEFDETNGFSGWWFIVLAIIALPAGFAGGLWHQDARQRERHGGFRI